MFEKPLIAIDVGSSSVKVIEMGGKGDSRKLLAMGLEVLPPSVIVDGEIRDKEGLEKILRELLKRLGLYKKNRRVALSLGGSGVLIKRAIVSPSADTDFSEQVFYEAQQSFQHDMDALYFRYQDMESKLVPKDQKAILMVGAKRDLVEQYLALVQGLDLKIGVIDCDVLCLANMFDFNYPIADAMVAVVNVGASSTQVFTMYNGEFLHTREFLMGGNDYTNKIMSSFNVDYDAAESLKVGAVVGGDQVQVGNIQAVMGEVNEMLSQEIATTLNFFREDETLPDALKQVRYIFLCGGGARSLGLDATIATNLQIPVQVISPFQRIDLKSSKLESNYIMSAGPIYGVCVGLGLRRFNDQAND